MFSGLNPKKMNALMKQMGISQQEINAKRVIIDKEQGRIIIDNPNIQKIVMQGQESFQITGDIREENQGEENKEKLEQDIQTIIEQTGVSREQASIELEKTNGDIAQAIINLSE